MVSPNLCWEAADWHEPQEDQDLFKTLNCIDTKISDPVGAIWP